MANLSARLARLEQRAVGPVPTTRTVLVRWGESFADAARRQPGQSRLTIALPEPMTFEEWEARAIAQQRALIDESR